MSSPTSSKKASDQNARGTLGIDAAAPRHGSIAGAGVGITSLNQQRPSFSKKKLDPSDPSTWTSPAAATFDRPRAASETVRAGGVPTINFPSDKEESVGSGGLGLSFDGSNDDRSQTKPSQPSELATATATTASQSTTTSETLPTQTKPSETAQATPSSPKASNDNPSSPKSPSLGVPGGETEDRRFSNQSASFSSITTDSDRIGHVSQEEEDNNEHALQESSDEEDYNSDRDNKSPVSERGRKRRSSRDSKSPERSDDGRSQESPPEPVITVEDTSGDRPPQPHPPNDSGKMSGTKPSKAVPKSGIARAASPAALSAIGDDDAELKRAKELVLKTSPIDETVKDRSVRMIIRGEWESFQDTDDEQTEFRHEPRLYLVCSDLSNEATYALEWTVGTLLKDGDTLLIINAMEDENAPKHKADEEPTMEIKMESAKAAEEATATMESLTRQTTNQEGVKQELKPSSKISSLKDARSLSRGNRPTSRKDADRVQAVERLEQDFLKFVRRTTLQVRTMIEVLHCRSPKHLILNAIDELEPTLVVVGTRGQSSLQGVVMGSFSNYLVTKSSIPVMVARRRLKKSRHAKVSSQQIRMTNNLMPFGVKQKRKSLTQARID